MQHNVRHVSYLTNQIGNINYVEAGEKERKKENENLKNWEEVKRKSQTPLH